MSRSIKKHVYYLSPLADQPHKSLKRFAAKKVRRYRVFDDVTNGAWHKRVFDSDLINGWISWRFWPDKKTIRKNPELERK